MALVALMMAAAACAKEPGDGPGEAIGKKQVVFCCLEESRTGIEGKNVVWEKGDALCIYDETAQNKFIYSSESEFTGEVSESATRFYAYYPDIYVNSGANAVARVEDAEELTFLTFIPSCQRVRAGSVSQGAIISACMPTLNGDRLTGTMKNLTALIKFSLEDAENHPVSKIRFTSSSTFMSGRCALVFGEEPVLSLGANSSTWVENKYVECVPETGSHFANGSYYLATFPKNTKGLTVSLYLENGQVYEYSYGSWVNLVANEVTNVGTLDRKLASEEGLTEKFSLIADFVNTVPEGIPASADKTEHSWSVTVGDGIYNFRSWNLYYKSSMPSCMYFNSSSSPKMAYVVCPAIEGKTLKEIVVTWKGVKNQGKNATYISGADADFTGKFSGIYYTSGTVDPANSQKKYAISVIGENNSYPLRVSHVYVLGKNSKGEYSATLTGDPEANTPYALFNNGSGLVSMIEYIQCIYE